ncbi:hypothetical protein [Duganella aceris]|uniref:Uncharacterized protein n=1 Tax=Duganella aceris TaxID=2703883 RepID=A0ABX0FPK2_9BURK|nr:hypothetical protein [Duganella aceris]NGZ86431.1 hypothetical protein [Duganella aceris]
MPPTTRRAALNALTEADTQEILVALQLQIWKFQASVDDGLDPQYWQSKLEAGKATYARVMTIRLAS